jgi:hypothetical protein
MPLQDWSNSNVSEGHPPCHRVATRSFRQSVGAEGSPPKTVGWVSGGAVQQDEPISLTRPSPSNRGGALRGQLTNRLSLRSDIPFPRECELRVAFGNVLGDGGHYVPQVSEVIVTAAWQNHKARCPRLAGMRGTLSGNSKAACRLVLPLKSKALRLESEATNAQNA